MEDTADIIRWHCIGCGYDLRGIQSNHCPECGREFDPNAPLSPRLTRYLEPIRWPLVYARRSMIVLILAQSVLLPPLWLALLFWLWIYCMIMIPCWLRFRRMDRASAYFSTEPESVRLNAAMLWQTRRWLALGLFLTLTALPQIIPFAVELPWLNHKAYILYEVDPILSPRSWRWCGLQPVSNVEVMPTGTYLNLGMTSLAYCEQEPSYESRPRGSWIHLIGHWWICAEAGWGFY